MESMNYTYEKKDVTKQANYKLGWAAGGGWSDDLWTMKYQAWVILNPKGRKIAEAISEKQAVIIVSALNGVAV